jgi:hypothetical protein
MCQYPLRAAHSYRALLRDDLSQIEGHAHHALAPAGYNGGQKAQSLRLPRIKKTRCVRQLAHEGVVRRDFREVRESTDVGGEADVNFLWD